MLKLALQPAQANYRVTDGDEVISTKLDGGAGRYRRDKIGATSDVVVQWPCQKAGEFDYIQAFYRLATASGSEPFLADLVIDIVELKEVVARFKPGTHNFTCMGGPNYAVSAVLEVEPPAADEAHDEALVALVGAFGLDGLEAGLLSLEHLANVTLPGISSE